MKQLRQGLINLCLMFSILFVLYLTLIPHHSIDTGTALGPARYFDYNLNPFILLESLPHVSLFYLVVDVIGNIVLFLPFGFCLTMKFPELKGVQILFLGAFFSSTIECIQLFLPNRITDIDDVILNTTGAVIGYFLFRRIEKEQKKEELEMAHAHMNDHS